MAKPQAVQKPKKVYEPRVKQNSDDVELMGVIEQDLGFGNYGVKIMDLDQIITAYV